MFNEKVNIQDDEEEFPFLFLSVLPLFSLSYNLKILYNLNLPSKLIRFRLKIFFKIA